VDKDAKRARTACQGILQQVAVRRSAAAGVGGEVARGGRGSETHPGRYVNVYCRKSVFCSLLYLFVFAAYLLHVCLAGGCSVVKSVVGWLHAVRFCRPGRTSHHPVHPPLPSGMLCVGCAGRSWQLFPMSVASSLLTFLVAMVSVCLLARRLG
jgi:hypothetical protein